MNTIELAIIREVANLWFGSDTVQHAIDSALKWIANEETVVARHKGILGELELAGLEMLDADAHLLLAIVQKLVGQDIVSTGVQG